MQLIFDSPKSVLLRRHLRRMLRVLFSKHENATKHMNVQIGGNTYRYKNSGAQDRGKSAILRPMMLAVESDWHQGQQNDACITSVR